MYGKAMINSWLAYTDIPLTCYVEHGVVYSQHPQIKHRLLWDCAYALDFVTNTTPSQSWKIDVNRFCRKSFAQLDALKRSRGEKLIWVDADVELEGPTNFDLFEPDDFIIYMGREGTYPCTSFIGWDTSHKHLGQFISAYEGIYTSGEVFAMRPYAHDCVVFEKAIQGLQSRNLTPEAKGFPNVFNDVFPNANHKKGPLKHGEIRATH